MRGLIAYGACVFGVTGCTLTTSLDGLTGGPPSDTNSPPTKSGAAGTSSGGPGASAGSANTPTGTIGATSLPADYRATVISDAPVAYYRLNDNGSVAKDEMGAHDGVYQGSMSHGPGAIRGDSDGALVATGDGWIDVAGGFPFTGNAPYSIEAWVAARSAATLTGVLARNLAPMGQTPTDGYSLYIETTLAPTMGRWTSSAEQSATAAGLTAGTFTYVVGTYDGTELTLYIDGVKTSRHPANSAIIEASTDMTIAATRNGAYGRFIGSLDEVALYDKPLSADRIAAHYDVGTR